MAQRSNKIPENYFLPFYHPDSLDNLRKSKDELGQINDDPLWSYKLGMELDKRVKSNKPSAWGLMEKGNTYAKDLGIGDANLNIAPTNTKGNPYPRAGGYADPIATGRVFIQDSKYDKPDPFSSGVMFHELAHVADILKDLPMEKRYGHHSGIGDNMAAKMLYSLQAQRAIEAGGLPDEDFVKAQMPWLKKVKPLSSNPIANPWALLPNKIDINSLPQVGLPIRGE